MNRNKKPTYDRSVLLLKRKGFDDHIRDAAHAGIAGVGDPGIICNGSGAVPGQINDRCG